jgi:hypothetical protein
MAYNSREILAWRKCLGNHQVIDNERYMAIDEIIQREEVEWPHRS